MRTHNLLVLLGCFLFFSLGPHSLAEEKARKVTPSVDVQFVLVDAEAKPTSVFLVPKDTKVALDLLFKATIPPAKASYSSWAIEVSEPKKGLLYQLEMSGEVPGVVHWDGFFSEKEKIKPGTQYFVRLILASDSGKNYASIWSPFTAKWARVERTQAIGEALSVYVVPRGSLSFLRVTTNAGASGFFPLTALEFDVVFKDRHHIAFGAQVTNNILFNSANIEQGLFYSEVGVAYRYQLVGAPVRPPQIPFVPDYAKNQVPETSVGRRAFGRVNNVQAGLRFFDATVRGLAGSTIDSNYARHFSGFSAVASYDQSFFPLRLHLAGEVGYSLVRGGLMRFAGMGGLSYDRIPALVPMIFGRYEVLSGSTAAEASRASTSVRNRLLSLGLEILFRI